MNSDEFAKACKDEMEIIFRSYISKDGETAVARHLAKLNLKEDKRIIAEKMIRDVMTDVYYGFLLSLDGESAMGGIQLQYKLYDEGGNLVFEPGELEADAWKYFQEKE